MREKMYVYIQKNSREKKPVVCAFSTLKEAEDYAYTALSYLGMKPEEYKLLERMIRHELPGDGIKVTKGKETYWLYIAECECC